MGGNGQRILELLGHFSIGKFFSEMFGALFVLYFTHKNWGSSRNPSPPPLMENTQIKASCIYFRSVPKIGMYHK